MGVQQARQAAWKERGGPAWRRDENTEMPKASASPPTRPFPICWHLPPQTDLVQLFPEPLSRHTVLGLGLAPAACQSPFHKPLRALLNGAPPQTDISLASGQMCPFSP